MSAGSVDLAEGEAEEAAESSMDGSDGVSNKKHLCSHCGIVVITTKTAHEEGHERDEGFSCAVCGVFISSCRERNSHEQAVHCFTRAQADEKVGGAVKISKSQLRQLVNVGFKLAEIQSAAAASAALRTEDDATEAELLAIMEENPQKDGLVCSTCGVQSSDRSAAERHFAAHRSTGRWICSLCGVRKTDVHQRNNHERRVHDFHRHPNDERREEAIRIAPEQWARYSQVGTNVAEIHTAAVESYVDAPPETVELQTVNTTKQFEKVACRICGYKLHGERFIARHEADHSVNGFECSLCGLRKVDAVQRNFHERKMHEFFRKEVDKKHKGPIQIPHDRLTHLKNVGKNVQDVQRRAIPSGSHAEPNGEQREVNRRHTVANPLQPAPSARALRKRPAVDVIQLDDSDDEQPQAAKACPPIGLQLPAPLPLPRPSAPLLHPPPVVQQPATPAPAPIPVVASSSANNPANGEERSAVRLITALVAKPSVLFYDHKKLSADFDVLPVRWWASARESSLLLLRSATPEWTGNVPLPPAVFRFTLADQFGDFLCFAKPTGAEAADRLRQLVASELTFTQLMSAVRELDFPSALIVASDADRAAVRHMSCPQFLVL